MSAGVDIQFVSVSTGGDSYTITTNQSCSTTSQTTITVSSDVTITGKVTGWWDFVANNHRYSQANVNLKLYIKLCSAQSGIALNGVTTSNKEEAVYVNDNRITGDFIPTSPTASNTTATLGTTDTLIVSWSGTFNRGSYEADQGELKFSFSINLDGSFFQASTDPATVTVQLTATLDGYLPEEVEYE